MAQEMPIPYKGIHKGFPVDKTPQEYSTNMDNVRPRDVLESRIRMGQRPGLKKWGAPTQVGGAEQPVVAMCSVSYVESPS